MINYRLMVQQMESIEAYSRDELYFHNVGSPEHVAELGTVLQSGTPLFTLKGRATLCRTGLSLRSEAFGGLGYHLVFLIPESGRELLVHPIYKTRFEPDDASKYPNWYTLAMRCTPEFVSAAIEWIHTQTIHNPFWRGFGQIQIGDVMMLSAEHLLGIY